MTKLLVNRLEYNVPNTAARTLADVLRNDLGLYGVRVSCGEGECGSCTVMMDGKPVTACLVLADQAEGRSMETIDSLGSADALHPIQQAFIEEQGFQCGACTPGFILAAKAFLEANPDPTDEEINVAMSGNICRCGAHPYIVRAVAKAAERIRQGGPAS